METGKKDEDFIYGLLRNPLRRTIIIHLYSNMEASAAELKSITGVSYGTLYYHLDALKPFLHVVGRGRFRLSDEGLRIARRLMEEKSLVARPEGPSAWEALALGFAFSRSGATTTTIIGAILLLHAVLMSSILDLSPSIMHLRSGFNAASWVISVALVMAYMLAAYSILRRGAGSARHVVSAVLLSYLPLALYLSIVSLAARLLGMSIPPLVIQAGFIAAHVWQLAILAAGLTHATGSGYEKSIPVVLLLSYLSLASAQQLLGPV